MQTSISIVKNERAKDAVRLLVGAAWYRCSILTCHGQDDRRYNKRDLNHLSTRVEHGKPVLLPLQGRLAARSDNGMRAEDGGESECLAVMAGIRIVTLSDAKAGRLPLGLRSRENLINRPNRISR